jgi:hypothetical protein
MAVKERTTTKLCIGIQHKYDSQKSNKRLMVETIIGETKREGQRIICKNFKKKKQKTLDPLVVGHYLIHGPSNVTCMQIVKSHSNGRSRTNITRQHNLPL